jgi:serine/threonine-protein kinase
MNHAEQQPADRYIVQRLLGRGHFAFVYLAWDRQEGKKVALKMAGAPVSATTARHPFSQEAGRLFLLRHPHIVDLLDYTILEQRPTLVMEYHPSTLRQRYRPAGGRQRPLPVAEMPHYLQQATDALAYAHASGIVHCDIKPENILLDEHGRLKISDFGIAVMLPAFARQEGIGGTRGYRAPEGSAGPQADQYSLAVTFYEGLTGHRPGLWQGLRALQASLFPGSVRAALLAVTLRALARRPRRRFPTIQDFTDACEQACARAQARPSHLRPVVALGAVLCVLLLGVALLLPAGSPTTPAPAPRHAAATADISATALVGAQVYRQATGSTPSLSSSLASQDGNNWQQSTDTTGSCQFTHGAYQVTSQRNGTRLSCLEQARSFSDLACQVDLLIASTPGDYGGLSVQAPPRGAYIFLIGTDQSYKFGTADAPSLATGFSSAIFTATNQWNRLTMIARGRTFYLYINQQFITAVSVPVAPRGSIGLNAEDDTSLTQVRFRHALAWQL